MRQLLLLPVLILIFGCIGAQPSQENSTTPNDTGSIPPKNQTGNASAPPNVSLPTSNNSSTLPAQNVSNQTAHPEIPSSNQTIRIAAFNIQIFGESKRSKPEVMSILTKTARNFDIMLVQELRDNTETTLPIYVDQINSLPGPKYAAVSSPRLGRTSSKENYAYVFNTETLQLLSNYTFTDPPAGSATDKFQREPFVARFGSKGGNFDFVLIGIHTDPDEAVQEIDDLSIVLDDAAEKFPDENDFIILGDLNADCAYLKLADPVSIKNASYLWLIPDSADTTTKSTDCTYDRIIATSSATEDYSGNWGVFRFDSEYGLNQSFTEQVSDHYPVWADFFTSKDSD